MPGDVDRAAPGGIDSAAPAVCHCQALRQASRRISALYDAALAPYGLRVSQYAILSRLARGGPQGGAWTVQALADALVMDRTTLGRNLRPLERDGLLRAAPDPADGRLRTLHITAPGEAILARSHPAWEAAQAGFERAYGPDRAGALRAALHAAVDAVPAPHAAAR